MGYVLVCSGIGDGEAKVILRENKGVGVLTGSLGIYHYHIL